MGEPIFHTVVGRYVINSVNDRGAFRQWCEENLAEGWDAFFFRGQATVTVCNPDDLTLLTLRWG